MGKSVGNGTPLFTSMPTVRKGTGLIEKLRKAPFEIFFCELENSKTSDSWSVDTPAAKGELEKTR
jgi:hypothetical protein